MALAVIGGLIFSTLLSLVFVPAMFSMMDDLGKQLSRLRRYVIASGGEEGREAARSPGH
jgi:hypothetical protein